MNKHARTSALLAALVSGAFATGSALAAEHKAGVWTNDQSVANGVVSARKVVAEQNGWLVVHRRCRSLKTDRLSKHIR